MDLASTKALSIAVALFVTIIVTSGVLFTISQMQNIYAQVYETDTNIHNMFGEFDAYDNTVKTGIEVMNAAKKYRDSDLVTVKIDITPINTTYNIKHILPGKLGANPGEVKYKSTVVESDGFATITFTKVVT